MAPFAVCLEGGKRMRYTRLAPRTLTIAGGVRRLCVVLSFICNPNSEG
jgi:hypothetical protein